MLRLSLSPREREALRLYSCGLARKRIALEMRISEHTVKDHLTAARRKLFARSTAHAVAIALRERVMP